MNIVQPTTSQPSLSNELIAKFRKIVGDKYALTDKADIAPYTTEERDLFHGHSPLVLRPGSTAEVAAICKLANEHRIALVPQGGNTGLVGGQTPHNGEVVISMKRMDRIREVDPASNTMTCEAGVILQIAQQRAADVDRLFPLSLGAEGSCTIGGNLSTNAGGTTALAYGVAREMALGVEVVLADGRVLNLLSKLKKDNTGYDLRNLFIGAEGTLGIITAATLKMFPKPRAIETAYVGLKSPADALKLLSLSQNEAAGTLTSFELLSELAVDFSVRHGIDVRDPLAEQVPLVCADGAVVAARRRPLRRWKPSSAKGMEDGIVDDAVIAANLSQRQAFWKLRDEMSAAQKPEGGSIKHDISVPVAAVPDFIAEADAAVVKLIPGSRPVPFGHLGDGNIHYNVSQPVGGNTADFMNRWHEVNKVVFDIVIQDGWLDLRRARHRRAQARRTARREGQDRDRVDARVQGDARSQRHHESRQGAVSKPSALAISAIEDRRPAGGHSALASAPAWSASGTIPRATSRWRARTAIRPSCSAARTARWWRPCSSAMTAIAAGSIMSASIPIIARKGYGRDIMTAAEDWLRARGIAKLQLMVRGDNAKVHAFYESIGYYDQKRATFAKWLDGRDPTP